MTLKYIRKTKCADDENCVEMVRVNIVLLIWNIVVKFHTDCFVPWTGTSNSCGLITLPELDTVKDSDSDSSPIQK